MARVHDLTVTEVLSATGGRLLFGRPNGIRGISIDSRSLGEGEYFVAIKGERFDGHEFVGEALNKAAGAIVSTPPPVAHAGKCVVLVDNTLTALQDIAHYIRMKYNPTVVGITGTNGKTTTKEMTSAILGARFRVLKNTGNLNNQVGLPLSLLGLGPDYDTAVLEMGASFPGDIKELCGIASPDYGVLTNIGHAHIEGFRDLATVRGTKLELLGSVGAVAVNADDLYLMEGVEASGFAGRIVRYGLGEGLEVRAVNVRLGRTEAFFELHSGGQSAEVRLSVSGMFNVYNALAAASAALLFGLKAEEVAEALKGFKGVPMRLELKDVRGALVISDAYNANPSSMEEALKELVRQRGTRAVAVLGDMLELGSYSEPAHRKIGEWMASADIDLFIAVGEAMAAAADVYLARGGKRVLKAPEAASARSMLMDNIKEGDTVLIKGSRGMKMEQVLEDKGAL